MLLNEVLKKTIQFFKDKKIESARLDAEILFAYGLNLKRIDLYVQHDRPLSESELNVCRELVKRRAQGEPIAYITKEKEFFGYPFYVDKNVLIPRPETEHLVEDALMWIEKEALAKKIYIADLGSGSGCIGLSLAKKLKLLNADLNQNVEQVDFELFLFEKSESAIQIIKKNIDRLTQAEDFCDKIKIIQCDLNQNIQDFIEQHSLLKTVKFDVVVANPPYIDKLDTRVQLEVKQFEPHTALFAEDSGYICIKNWSTLFTQMLNNKSLFLMEIGSEQGPTALGHFKSLDYYSDLGTQGQVKIKKDLAGLDRYVYALRQ